jgi:hypothetical protein
MHGYAPPPPGLSHDHVHGKFQWSDHSCLAYNPDGDSVPAYTPPEGGSKAKPVQSYAEIPPPGPPPSQSDEGPSYKAPEVVITPPEASSSSYPR